MSDRIEEIRGILYGTEEREASDHLNIDDGKWLLAALGRVTQERDAALSTGWAYKEEWMRAEAAERRVKELTERVNDAAVVIERMANGASRQECSPELDRVIAALASGSPEGTTGEGGVNEASPARRSTDVTSGAERRAPLLASSTSPPAVDPSGSPEGSEG